MMVALYVVATPIGNLEDISYRAVKILKTVDYIAAEDTRHSSRLLQHYAITTPMLAYHEHSGESQTEKVVSLLQQGKSIALISDAGTPLISDPGYRLVTRLQALHLPVIPIPGANAMIAALSSSGLPTDHFSFEGFLPAKQKARLDTLQTLVDAPRTLVFYEAPHRIVDSLNDMCTVFGERRRITLARELTKNFETISQKSLGEMRDWVASDADQQRGEIVLVIEGAINARNELISGPAVKLVMQLMDELPPRQLSKIVAEHYSVPQKQVYEYVLSLKK